MVDTKWNCVIKEYIEEILTGSPVVLSLTYQLPLKAYDHAFDQMMKIASTKMTEF